jgi:glycosyltransferase involved in cell wall biosynthesis
MVKLSVVLATRNEEANIGRCLESVKDIADEIIIFDEKSDDDTVKIAKDFGAKVFSVAHVDNFHITKQRAIDKATGEWILQLDADEVVTKDLAQEILKVLGRTTEEIKARKIDSLLLRHQAVVEDRDGKLGKKSGEVVAFFIPRLNMFLGKPLIHGGVYPDGVIRLIKNGKAHLPAKSVHEQMEIDGEVSWLNSPLEHYDSPTISRYVARMNRYTDLHAGELKKANTSKSKIQFLNYTIIKPKLAFLRIYLRHRGYKDGLHGFVWALFSAMHFPIAYYKYLNHEGSN